MNIAFPNDSPGREDSSSRTVSFILSQKAGHHPSKIYKTYVIPSSQRAMENYSHFRVQVGLGFQPVKGRNSLYEDKIRLGLAEPNFGVMRDGRDGWISADP
jgi:hypothetical protein